ncbi:deoxyribose-phosphate aldolase [Kocuria sp. LUK]|uniref:deoxyribose-phosphate aldolase n=1 Tax=Kocuria sp. LUK TaxID=2897828 RepID=UPI001E3372C7|nr:deoxyribose-phosphate aldolase [Kocuria sp. LUK]MCD1144993.1 deoxyribose-phosphate aldolase [Kocuria sp. LUK]
MSDAPNLAPYIDSTLLKPEASRDQIAALCEEAKQYSFASVCTNPLWAGFVRERLAGSDVKSCVVVGFPLGASATEVKAFETRTAVDAGAQEIDMVIDIAAARANERETLERDIRAVAEATHAGGALLKVIIETCLLDDDAKVLACEAAVAAGADFVKTSTGFSTAGATVADVRLMRATVGPDIGVKASGGIRTREDALAMIEAGASRIGASSGPALLS